ncbi:GhoT/OrtT family toxin [Escherichia albertii]|nr:GhoT/OrtT family toxin [Escherichia albertii]
MTHICAHFIYLAGRLYMSLFQYILIFYAVMAVIAFIITWFLSYDKKSIRFLSAFLVGVTWPISFPVALLFSLF